jgi:hypothetical protein
MSLEQALPDRRLERRELEVGAGIALENKLHRPGTQVADAIKKHDSSVHGSYSFD